MHYEHTAIADADVPQAVEPIFQAVYKPQRPLARPSSTQAECN